MSKLFICILFALVVHTQTGFSQKTKPDYAKNSIQIGKTGYYFDKENSYRFGDILIYSPGEKVLLYFPYIGYIRKINRNFGFKVSIEQYSDCYVCDNLAVWPPIPVYEIRSRYFKHLQFNLIYEFSASKRLSMILIGGSGYRWALYGQFWNVGYIDHGGLKETLSDGKSFHEWGVGGAIEVKYKFYKEFSLSVKGEYFSFPAQPVRHFGAGGYIGYDF